MMQLSLEESKWVKAKFFKWKNRENEVKMDGKGLNIRNKTTSKKKKYIVGTVSMSRSWPSH